MINFYNFFYIDKNIVLSLVYLLISSKQVSFVRNDVISIYIFESNRRLFINTEEWHE